MDQLNGKVAVVTGGASGIGLALARRFCAEDMSVVIADIEPGPLVEAAEGLRASGARVLDIVTDVSDAGQVEMLARRTVEHFGGVHVVCNNAGVGASGPAWEVPLEDWDWVLGVNLYGVLHGIRSFVPRLLAGGEGHVVNTASFSGLVNLFLSPPYSVSKAAVISLSESLYFQLIAAGAPVGVSVLCPGWVNTRIADSERNRPPTAPARPTAPRAERAHAALKEVVGSGMSPMDVADHVVAAVRKRRFYVLPHHDAEHLGMVSRRTAAILEGGNPEIPVSPGMQSVLAAMSGDH